MLSKEHISKLEEKVDGKYVIRDQIKDWAKKHKSISNCYINKDISPWSEFHQPKYPSFVISIPGYTLTCRCFPSTCSTLIVHNIVPRHEVFDAMEELAEIFEYTQILLQATNEYFDEHGNRLWSFLEERGYNELSNHINKRTGNSIKLFNKII